MAFEQEILEYLLKVQGVADVENAGGAASAAEGKFERLRDELARFVAASGAAAKAAEKLEGDTYDVGNSYEVLEKQLGRATTAMEKEAVAAQWMARQARELDDVLEALARHEREAATAADAVTAAGAKGAAATRQAGDAAGYGALKWMLLGNAIQDAQYGFAAIVNNIPQLTLAFGGTAGLAGGIGIAAVAAQQLLAHIGDLKALLASETESRLVYDLKGLQEVLDKIDAKPIKSRIDYSDYDIAKEKLRKLTEAQAAFERLKSGKSRAAQEAGRLATEAIVEHGGGDDFTSSAEQVARAAAEVTTPGESAKSREAREMRDEARRQLDKATDPERVAGLEAALARYNHAFTKAQGEDYKNHVDVTRGKVGRAGEGYSGDLNWLRDLVAANPEKFAAQGAGPGLLPGLMKAGRDQIEDRKAGENARKIAEDAAKQAKKLQDDRDKEANDLNQRVNKAVAAHGPGLDDAVQNNIWLDLKKGRGLDAAKASNREDVLAALKGRGVGDDIIGRAADQIVEKAGDIARNHVAEGTKPKFIAQADAARKKADADHLREVNQEVGRVKPAFDDALERALLRRVAGGDGIDGAAGALDAQLRRRLGSRMVPPALQADVSSEIMRQIGNKVANSLATATNPRVAAAQAVVHGEARAAEGFANEFRSRAGATPEQAQHAGRLTAGLVGQGVDAGTAMDAVYRAMTGHVEQVGDTLRQMIIQQQALLNVIGAATAEINDLKGVVAQQGVKVNTVASNLGRGQARDRSGLMTLSGN